MKKLPQISSSEWKVMEVVWENPPVTAQHVSDVLGEQEQWKPQTVKTLLARLVKKGVLEYESEGRRFHYLPAIGREEAVAAETGTFLERVARGSVAPLLSHLVQSRRQWSGEEIAELRKLLDDAKNGGAK